MLPDKAILAKFSALMVYAKVSVHFFKTMVLECLCKLQKHIYIRSTIHLSQSNTQVFNVCIPAESRKL